MMLLLNWNELHTKIFPLSVCRDPLRVYAIHCVCVCVCDYSRPLVDSYQSNCSYACAI